MQKPSIPKGTRDFSPAEMVKRDFIFNTIRDVFRLHGYLPVETPAMENLSTLLGKYGEEGDKLLFRVLNSGDFLKDVPTRELEEKNLSKIGNIISGKGLRYDLTVPFARYVVQNRNEITFPFRRYQIQPVWRADKPQKGRYREFYQCDADIIGSDSLLNEAELLQIIDEVFKKLNLKVTIKINNRKVLSGIAEIAGMPEKFTDFTVALDKLDKIGRDKVFEELRENGFTDVHLKTLSGFFDVFSLSNQEKVQFLVNNLKESETGLQGVNEIQKLFDYLEHLDIDSEVQFDISLARGLNYYTGAIIEVKTNEMQIGSICGGGRYDNLTGIFGLKNVSGVGISFGAERIYDVMEALERFPSETTRTTDILFVNFGEKEAFFAMQTMTELRHRNICCELYPDPVKMKKQFNYANTRQIPFVGIIGEEEINTGMIMIKNMSTGDQSPVERGKLADYLTTNI
ncbi:MAG: histidine--tRNA ligase [Bacteroidota bacterium]